MADIPTAMHDLVTALFTRVLLNNNYKNVIEIGSFDLQTIIGLKVNFPETRCIALDIGKFFQSNSGPTAVGGMEIEIGYLSPGIFRTLALVGPTLLVCRGTMAYMSQIELKGYLKEFATLGMDIALIEPSPYFLPSKSTARAAHRNTASWYHPYDQLLTELGYELATPANGAVGMSGSISGFECMRFQYATLDRASLRDRSGPSNPNETSV